MGETERADRLSDAVAGPAAYPDASRSAVTLFPFDRAGATAIEYALIAGLISIVIVAAVTSIGTSLSGFFNSIAPYV